MDDLAGTEPPGLLSQKVDALDRAHLGGQIVSSTPGQNFLDADGRIG
jgi:hypothetical protein